MTRRGGVSVGSKPSTGAVIGRVGKLSAAAAALLSRSGAFGGIESDPDRDPLGEPLGQTSHVFGGTTPIPPETFLDPQLGVQPTTLVPQPQRVSTRAIRLTDLSLEPSVWLAVTIDRPTILWPRNPFVGGQIRYAPDTPDSSLTRIQTSVRSGIVYLPTPGQWYVRQTTSSTVTMTVIDASDPAVQVRYLAEPGNQLLAQTVIDPATIGTSAAGNSVQIAPSSRERTGILIGNNDATVNLLVGFNLTAGVGYVALTTAVLYVEPKKTLELFGDQCFRSNLVAWWQGAAAGTVGPSVFQWF